MFYLPNNLSNLSYDATSNELLELSSDLFWIQDKDFRFTCFFGSDRRFDPNLIDFLGKCHWELPLINVDPMIITTHKIQLNNHNPFSNLRCSLYNHAGKLQHLSISGEPIYDNCQNFIGYRGVSRNITELIDAETVVKEYNSQLNQIIDNMPVPTFVLDAAHKVIYWNQACEKLTGFSRSDIIGFDSIRRKEYHLDIALADLILDRVDIGTMGSYFENLQESKLITGAYEANRYVPQLNRWIHITSAPLFDSHHEILGVIETMQDISEQRRMESELKALSHKDGLTGIGNRRFFDVSFKSLWSSCGVSNQPLSLMMLDVDYFKDYNDTYGHQAGDVCLKTIATMLDNLTLPSNSIVARYGGEEFIILLPNCNIQAVSNIAEMIQSSIHLLDLPHLHGIFKKVTLSIGVSTVIPNLDMHLDMLILAADNALYDAKNNGRDCIKFNTY